jgi:heat shock protein 4
VVQYNNEDIVVSAEHALAMVLVKAKEVATKANGNVGIGDSVLAVPYWFTDAQRRGLLHACEIADLHCLKITNESTAIALSYGIFKSAKKLFSETEPTHIMFIDLGYTCYTVTIVDFIQENMRVLSTVCDRNLGGRDFDDVIIEFLAESFQKKTGINVRGNIKAILKLQVAAEKAKKTLSPNGVNEAAISVECLADDRDLSVNLSKEEFESRCAGLIARLEGPVIKALAEAGLTREQVTETEIVGGTSRVSCIKRRLGEILGLDPTAMNFGLKTTMNSDEAVARGCALQSAMSSSRMKVKPFNIVDKLAYGIILHFDNVNNTGNFEAESKEDEEAKGNSARIFSRGDDVPHKPRRLNFNKRTGDFTITAVYDESATENLPPGEDKLIGKYTVKVPSDLVASGPKDIRVTFGLDKNGCFYAQSAQLMEEIILTPEEVAAEADAKEKEKSEGEGKMEVVEGKEGGEEKAAPKKKYRKVELTVITEHFGLHRDQIKAAIELEASMAFEDKLIIETADKRNELEAYIYSMRDKLDGSLKAFATSAERDTLKKLMNDAEEWLYGDGFDSTKQMYARKIDELREKGDPIETREREDEQRPAAVENLRKQIEKCKVFVGTYEDAHAHITEDERDKIRSEFHRTESWLFDQLSRQGDLPKNVDPVPLRRRRPPRLKAAVRSPSRVRARRPMGATAVYPWMMGPRRTRTRTRQRIAPARNPWRLNG